MPSDVGLRLLVIGSLVKSMGPRVRFKQGHACFGQCDFLWGYLLLLFLNPVRDDSRLLSVEEIQHAIVHISRLGAKLVDSFAQVFRRRASQLVALLSKEGELGEALVLGMFR